MVDRPTWTVEIDGPPDEIERLLASELTAAERAMLAVRRLPRSADPDDPGRVGEIEWARLTIEFVATSVAGGITYDLIKKVVKHAVKRFGADRVR